MIYDSINNVNSVVAFCLLQEALGRGPKHYAEATAQDLEGP